MHITGWHLAPSFELVKGSPENAIGVLLAELAERIDVRVLVWSGAPIPAFHPTRSEVSTTLHNLTRRTRIQARGDPREHPFHCHHEKTIVIDGELAFVGGIDLTDSAGDRYDTQQHEARRRIGWHDVATRLRGPAVADVGEHFRVRWRELTGQPLPELTPPPRRRRHDRAGPAHGPGGHVRLDPETVNFGSSRATCARSRSARELIYIENQFLWSPELVVVIADKLRNPPTPDFRVVVVLPAKANNGAEDTRGQVRVLLDADRRRRAHARRDHPLPVASQRPRGPALRPRQGRGRR